MDYLLEPRGNNMGRKKKHKDPERFYLLPGQGGKLYRKKQRWIIFWSLVAAGLVAGIIGTMMYFIDRL
ncbi:MAG: hypothetical protein ACLQSR_12550 [Limisphaerales bacterium]